ncbi:MAG: HEPN domain-containing protein [Candidatus Caldarchaeales archaeon]
MAVWERWLAKARLFARYAEDNFREARYDAAAFYAQQAAEVLLIGILLKRTGARPYTHSLTEMLGALGRIHGREVPRGVLISAAKLERHYLASRYPDAGAVEYSEWEAEEALRCMREVLEFVRSLGEDF